MLTMAPLLLSRQRCQQENDDDVIFWTAQAGRPVYSERMALGLYGLIFWEDDEWHLVVCRGYARIAYVIGSRPYVLRALAALGLSPSVSSFSEDWDRSRVTLIGG